MILLANGLSMIKLMQGSEEINSNGGFSFVKRLLGAAGLLPAADALTPSFGVVEDKVPVG